MGIGVSRHWTLLRNHPAAHSTGNNKSRSNHAIGDRTESGHRAAIASAASLPYQILSRGIIPLSGDIPNASAATAAAAIASQLVLKISIAYHATNASRRSRAQRTWRRHTSAAVR